MLECRRLISYYPSSKLTGEAIYLMGESFLGAGNYKDAALAFERHYSEHRGSLTKVAESYYRAGRFGSGIAKLKDYASETDAADYLIGWGYLGKHLFNESSIVFHYLSTREGEFKEASASLSKDSLLGLRLPSKSPWVSGILSAVLPGLGQVYSERAYDGMISFFFNAVFLYLAVENNRIGNYGMGAFFSVIELGWYTGNIYSAVGAAHKYNKNQAEDFVRGLQVKYGFEF